MIDGRIPIFTVEYRSQHERWFLTSVTPPGLEPRCVAVAHTDITERKNMERTLRDNVTDLIHFNEAIVNRELHMIELKREVNRLSAQAGLLPRYAVEFDQEQT